LRLGTSRRLSTLWRYRRRRRACRGLNLLTDRRPRLLTGRRGFTDRRRRGPILLTRGRCRANYRLSLLTDGRGLGRDGLNPLADRRLNLFADRRGFTDRRRVRWNLLTRSGLRARCGRWLCLPPWRGGILPSGGGDGFGSRVRRRRRLWSYLGLDRTLGYSRRGTGAYNRSDGTNLGRVDRPDLHAAWSEALARGLGAQRL
jgi:hypothetical protein